MTPRSEGRDGEGRAGTPYLSPDHNKLIADSAISGEVAAERGYFTATTAAALGRLGFAPYQRIAPALVVPIHSVDAKEGICNYQARPDQPRIDAARGRLVRYENVADSRVRLDCPPRCRPMLASPRRSLWITEGARKADALASAGLCAVDVLGVDCFNVDGDWERVALDGRDVYVCFDNDVMVNPTVHGALARLAAFLGSRGAALHFVYLPTDNGKVGVDDFLAAHGPDTGPLYARAEHRLRDLPPQAKPHAPVAWPATWLLREVVRLLGRFVRFGSAHELAVLALFTLHTWAIDAAIVTPYVLVVSPEKRSGKTRALEVVELVVREPLRAANITAAGVFQAIEAWAPTLLVDEVDAIFTARSEHAEALRSVLNAGNRRGAFVVRGSSEGEPVRFATFAPRLLAGINVGTLPDTIRDRAIVISLDRKRRDEPVDDLFVDDLREPVETLRGRLAEWADENREALASMRRAERILALDDRRQEAWDPLLAIARHAGGDWPRLAREAAVALANRAADPAEEAHGHLLLGELHAMFNDGSTNALASRDICRSLNDNEELPFAHYRRFEGIDPTGLAKLLRPYGIRPKNVPSPGSTRQVKGYEVDQFSETWGRYLGVSDTSTRAPNPQVAVSTVSTVSPSPLQGFPETALLSRAIAPVSAIGGETTVRRRRDCPAVSQSPCKSTPETVETAETAPGVAGSRAPFNESPGSIQPTCEHPSHRPSDWRMPDAAMWVCGVCHPPPRGALDLVHRGGAGS